MRKKVLTKNNKVQNALLAVETIAAAFMSPLVGHAGFDTSVTINTNALNGVNPFDIAGKGIGIILSVLQIFGIGVLIWGVVSVVQSTQDNGDPNKRAQGFASIATAAVLIGMKFVLQAIGVIA